MSGGLVERQVGVDRVDHAENGDRGGNQHAADPRQYFPGRVGPKHADGLFCGR